MKMIHLGEKFEAREIDEDEEYNVVSRKISRNVYAYTKRLHMKE